MNDSPALPEGTRHGRRTRRSRRDPLAMQINILLDVLLWLAIRLNGREAAHLTLTELGRLFSLHGHNFATLADLLGRAQVLTPETLQLILQAYDCGISEVLRYRGASE